MESGGGPSESLEDFLRSFPYEERREQQLELTTSSELQDFGDGIYSGQRVYGNKNIKLFINTNFRQAFVALEIESPLQEFTAESLHERVSDLIRAAYPRMPTHDITPTAVFFADSRYSDFDLRDAWQMKSYERRLSQPFDMLYFDLRIENGPQTDLVPLTQTPSFQVGYRRTMNVFMEYISMNHFKASSADADLAGAILGTGRAGDAPNLARWIRDSGRNYPAQTGM